MEIIRKGTQPASKGSADYFTGDVHIEAPFQRGGGSRLQGGIVTFAPGARSNWHAHRLGQTLVAPARQGLNPVRRPGRSLKSTPATSSGVPRATSIGMAPRQPPSMTHIAIQEALDGKVVDWMEPVTDAHYIASPGADPRHPPSIKYPRQETYRWPPKPTAPSPPTSRLSHGHRAPRARPERCRRSRSPSAASATPTSTPRAANGAGTSTRACPGHEIVGRVTAVGERGDASSRSATSPASAAWSTPAALRRLRRRASSSTATDGVTGTYNAPTQDGRGRHLRRLLASTSSSTRTSC